MSATIAPGSSGIFGRHGRYAASITHATSPVLIGLLGAVLGMWLLAPEAITDGRALITVLLMPLLFASVAIYSWTVLNPGEYVGLVIDTEQRTLELVQSNPFAERRTTVPFADVVHVSRETCAEEAGEHDKNAVVVELRSGKVVTLALQLDDGHVAELRRLLQIAA